MVTYLKTKNRNQLIWLGNTIGGFIKESQRTRPWHMAINGDHDSGKSLIALAIDAVFRPQEYPRGILSKNRHVADNLMIGPVIFRNVSQSPAMCRDAFDKTLTDFQASRPLAHVVILSNVKRTFSESFQAATDGLDSDILDIDIRVKRGNGSIRHIAVNAADESLTSLLENSYYAKDMPKPRSYAPHPPA